VKLKVCLWLKNLDEGCANGFWRSDAEFARRERGESSTPEFWDKRHLPAPTTRVAFAAIVTV
jgi:hypothetical protein